MNNIPYTQSEFINKIRGINPNIEVLGNYISSHEKISVRCKKCGLEWSPRAYGLIQGRGCPECGKSLAIENRKGKTAQKTTEQFIMELSQVNKGITVLGKYTGNRNRIECSCNACGHRWAAIPYTLLNGNGCPNCNKLKRMNYRRYSPDSFKKKLYDTNPDIELLADFTRSTEPIEVKCKKCGNIWFPKAYSLLQGRGCPNCSHKTGAIHNLGKTGLKSSKQFIEELFKIDDSIEVIGDYVNTHTNINVKCNRCNHIWTAKPYALLQGHGCPRCAKSGTSFMEQLILLSFRKVLGDDEVLSRDKTMINMELDIVIPKYKTAIEPGNWFLHKRAIKRDEEKRNRCKEKGYNLFTIYDKYPKDLEPPFPENCYVFSDDLNIADHSTIHKLIYDLFSECSISNRFSIEEWNKLEDLAYTNSKAFTHTDFVNRLSIIRPDIEVVGKYENANRRIEVRCRNCGFSWYGVPANLLSGDGCKKCGAKKRGENSRKGQKQFEEEIESLIPTIKVIGTYISRHKPIRVQCLMCGTIWEPTPGSLLRKDHYKTNNNGCPSCSKAKMGTPKKRVMNIDTGEVFDSAVEAGRKYNTVPSSIRQCCRGISKTSNGYHWMYIE